MLRRAAITILIIAAVTSLASCGARKDEKTDYDRNVVRARETVLRDNLYQLRKTIDLYAADRAALPQSLDDLVKAGYLREIPEDPMTGKMDWKIVLGDDPNAAGRKGITNVRSASTAKSSEGTPYSDW
ncbi:MAG TPA: hypothetical protein VD861_22050 [Pyrinomonadaceae bacterium]|nr:hypothetical protein [Pyrinomonadaceae bacterium]